jgi:hypothetical protein
MVKKFLTTVLPGILKPLQILWNQMLGFLFLAFAAVLIRPLWRAWSDPDKDGGDLWRLFLSGFFFLVLVAYGLHALFRARHISRR